MSNHNEIRPLENVSAFEHFSNAAVNTLATTVSVAMAFNPVAQDKPALVAAIGVTGLVATGCAALRIGLGARALRR